MDNLPLLYNTPDDWAPAVLKDPLALLSDHAHLEKKAATNALDLVNRWPLKINPDQWTHSLSNIAKDETDHLQAVMKILTKRRGKLARGHRNVYTMELRELVRNGEGPMELLDRLLVSSLIEARSCERFKHLATHTMDRELKTFYRNLWTSELGHYKIFYQLAEMILPKETVAERWVFMLKEEAKIIAHQMPGPRMHSGAPNIN